jgi:hypothetical protein
MIHAGIARIFHQPGNNNATATATAVSIMCSFDSYTTHRAARAL